MLFGYKPATFPKCALILYFTCRVLIDKIQRFSEHGSTTFSWNACTSSTEEDGLQWGPHVLSCMRM